MQGSDIVDPGRRGFLRTSGTAVAGAIEAIRKRSDRLRYIGVRHDEAAAFMAGGRAKRTGGPGVCVATTGPGAVHLMNGLYDAASTGRRWWPSPA